MADPAHRHGGPDAGWYVPGPDGWQRISDAEAWDHDDAAHFGSDPNGRHSVVATRKRTAEESLAEARRFSALLGSGPLRGWIPDHGQKPPAS